MTCVQCSEKTLYDKTISRRVQTASRRSKRTLAGMAVLGLFVGGSAASLSPATAAQDFSGFTTHAHATPLRIELHEPAIPVPATPQLEFNFSYTKVDGASGPIGTARASAMWPGDAVGEGLKTFGEQLGLPGALTDGGYPAQVNAQSPGETQSAAQEFLPGSVGRVSTSDKRATAKVGYGTVGDVEEDDPSGGSSTKPPNLLDMLQDPGASLTGVIGGLLGTNPSKDVTPPSGSPLGALGALVSVAGMDSASTTVYDPDADTVTASATARLGRIKLLAGLIQLDGVDVVTKTVSNIAGGAKVSKKVLIGGMSVAGNRFGYTGTGFEAMGKENPIPGLPDDPMQALAKLGVSFHLGKVTQKTEGASGAISAEALRITIDTAPLLSLLPKLPLNDLVSQLPDLPGQAAILKGLIVALGDAHPRLDLVLGQAATNAQTVAGIDGGDGGDGGGDGGDGGTVAPPTDGGTPPIDSGTPPLAGPGTPETGPETTPPGDLPGTIPTSALPALGSVPMALILGGMLLAGGLGWYIRRAGMVLFGGASTCTHGLKAGIPDLRKV